ncbi:MAG TPA: magnesium transporter [Acidimicrobiia bacterium]
MLRFPRELAMRLRDLARRRPQEVEEYLDQHAQEWEALVEADPHDAADILEELPDDTAAGLIAGLEQQKAADVLDEMRPELAADVLEELPTADAAALVEQMQLHEAADLIAALEPESFDAVMDALEDDVAARLEQLLAYPPDSAGGLMKTEVAQLPVGMSVGEAIEALRRLHETLDDLSYVYITDEHRRLVGVLSFRDLVFARPSTGLDQVMVHSPVAVSAETDREIVSELIKRYNLFSLPVVDHRQRLLGMVSVEHAMEAAEQEASEDFAQAVGAGAEETVFTPVRRSIRSRLPWMLVNLGLASIVALVIERQTGVIEANAVLAALMPVVAVMGGNSGAQALAVVVRSMAVGAVPPNREWSVIGSQTAIGFANGLAVGALSAAIAYVLADATVALAVGLGVLANMTIAGFAGGGIPILFRHLGRDPALASNIFLILITDLVGFGGFLLVATALL